MIFLLLEILAKFFGFPRVAVVFACARWSNWKFKLFAACKQQKVTGIDDQIWNLYSHLAVVIHLFIEFNKLFCVGHLDSWVESHLALNIGTLCHALGHEFEPRWQETLFRTPAQHLHFLHDCVWFIWFDTIICLSNLLGELWNRQLKINEIYFEKNKIFCFPELWSIPLFDLSLDSMTKINSWAVVVAQLSGRLLPIPEVHGSNPVIGEFFHNIDCQLYWKDKHKEKKRPGMAHIKKSIPGSEQTMTNIKLLSTTWEIWAN